jgi:hypothetical protein
LVKGIYIVPTAAFGTNLKNKMESKLFIALLVAALLAFSAAHDDDSNGSDSGSESLGSWGDSFEEQDDDCDRLVDGSDDNDGKCDLTDGLEEVPDKCDCTAEEKTTLIEWITSLKVELKVKVSIEERLTIASASILKFQMENPTLYEMIQYQNVSSWGYLASFTKIVEFRQTKKIESLITLDDEDNCPLFDFLFNCTDGSYEQQSAVEALINETLIEICGDMTLSITKKNVAIFKALSKFFSINAEWQFKFFTSKMVGFGSFQSFFQITKSFYQKTQVDVILEGDVEECGFMVAFKNQLEMIKTDTTISITIKGILNQFYARILQQLKLGGLKGKARLAIIIKEIRKLIKFHPQPEFIKCILGINIFDFGSFLDLIFCGPGKIGFEPKPTPMIPSPKPTCSCTCGSTFMP